MGEEVCHCSCRTPIYRELIPHIRWSFNLTLLIAGVFGLAAGGSPDFVTLASLIAVVGVGVGGRSFRLVGVKPSI